jgi:hypothetical protein
MAYEASREDLRQKPGVKPRLEITLAIPTVGDPSAEEVVYEASDLTLGQVQAIGGLSKLRRTASRYSWGHPVGFDREGYFVIETIAEDSQQGHARPGAIRAIRFDASKGEPLIHAPSKGLP